jgi:hypothetical protein
MSKWSFGDIFWISVLIAVGYVIVKDDVFSDYRPDYIKYVEDSRNGCVLRTEVQLSNHMVHIRKTEYRPKVLRVYDCANNNTAATILEK